MKNVIIVRYGELSTKGKNKKDFIRLLAKNIASSLKEFDDVTIKPSFDHTYIYYQNHLNEIIDILKDISGIHSFSLGYELELDYDEIKNDITKKVLEISHNYHTFKIFVKRANKTFPYNSDYITRELASIILKNSNLKVDVHHPSLEVKIEIRMENSYLYFQTINGAGGYPLGVGGKVIMMLSGGIDSPVASYLLMKRGVNIEAVHFASPPYTNSGVILKIKDLLSVLTRYQTRIKLHVVRFTEIQDAIYSCADESYAITLMRRMMYRLASKLAKKTHSLAIASGESIGQVASQTLDSLGVINEVTNLPIIRPLITYDKEEIIKISKRIKTYDISIRPYEDCCTIFTPKNPKTKPSLEKAKYYESLFNFEELIDKAISEEEIIYLNREEI